MDDKLSILREKAEKVLNESINLQTDMQANDFNRIIHDLKVYQIELEIQNEELRSTQEKLVNSRDKFARLYNEAPVGYVTLSQNSIIMQANQTFADMVNRDLSRILNIGFSEFLTEEDSLIFQSRFNAFFKKPDDKSMELKMVKRGGDNIFARISGSLKIDDSTDPRNETRQLKLFLIVSDITKQKLAEELLIQSELNYRTLADSGSSLIRTIDTNKGCTYFNSVWSNFTGQSPETDLGNEWLENVHQEDIEHVRAKYSDGFDKKEKYNLEYRLLHGFILS